MSLDCVVKPEHAEETHEDVGNMKVHRKAPVQQEV